jgi:hypothetical protein
MKEFLLDDASLAICKWRYHRKTKSYYSNEHFVSASNPEKIKLQAPVKLPTFPKLYSLMIAKNNITSLGADLILYSLRELYINNNRIGSVVPYKAPKPSVVGRSRANSIGSVASTRLGTADSNAGRGFFGNNNDNPSPSKARSSNDSSSLTPFPSLEILDVSDNRIVGAFQDVSSIVAKNFIELTEWYVDGNPTLEEGEGLALMEMSPTRRPGSPTRRGSPTRLGSPAKINSSPTRSSPDAKKNLNGSPGSPSRRTLRGSPKRSPNASPKTSPSSSSSGHVSPRSKESRRNAMLEKRRKATLKVIRKSGFRSLELFNDACVNVDEDDEGNGKNKSKGGKGKKKKTTIDSTSGLLGRKELSAALGAELEEDNSDFDSDNDDLDDTGFFGESNRSGNRTGGNSPHNKLNDTILRGVGKDLPDPLSLAEMEEELKKLEAEDLKEQMFEASINNNDLETVLKNIEGLDENDAAEFKREESSPSKRKNGGMGNRGSPSTANQNQLLENGSGNVSPNTAAKNAKKAASKTEMDAIGLRIRDATRKSHRRALMEGKGGGSSEI